MNKVPADPASPLTIVHSSIYRRVLHLGETVQRGRKQMRDMEMAFVMSCCVTLQLEHYTVRARRRRAHVTSQLH